jgi:glycine cleavage system aminomethyltransferase T
VSLAEEVKALRTSAGLSRAAQVAAVRVDGPDAFDLLQSASTRSPYLREGKVLHTLLLRDDAGLLADALVVTADDGFVVLAEGPGEGELVAWLEGLKQRRSPPRQAEIRGMSAEWEVFGADGPYAWELVAGLLGPVVLGMPYLTLLRRDDILCVRAGKTGEYGYLLLVPSAVARQVEAKLERIGALLGLVAVGCDALDVCALENWHFTMRALHETALALPLTPLEMQLQWRVVYGREFVGAAALRARRAAGPRVRATCFVAEGPVAPGHRVRLAGHDVGEVLASCDSPTVGCVVGSALLELPFAHPHLALTAATPAGAVPLRTCTAPLVDNVSLRVDPHKHTYATRADGESPREPR